MAKRKHSHGRKRRSQHAVAHGDAGRQGSGSTALILWGLHPARAALANPDRKVYAIWATESAARSLTADGGQTSLTILSNPEISDRLPPGAVHQGVVLAVAPLPTRSLVSFLGEDMADRPLVVLDQITDPHNVGAILRSCAVFGAAALVTTNRHSPPESGALAKSAAGALDVVPWVRVGNLAQTLNAIRDAGWWIAGLAGEEDTALSEAGLGREGARTAIVLGSEGNGLRRLTKEKCDILVRLPIPYANKKDRVNLIDSLNVSNAAAVALYELRRN